MTFYNNEITIEEDYFALTLALLRRGETSNEHPLVKRQVSLKYKLIDKGLNADEIANIFRSAENTYKALEY